MKNKKLIGIIAGVVIVFIIGVIIFYNVGISSVSSKDEDVIVTVEEGSTSSSILDALDEAGLVKNKLCGQIFLKLNRYDHLQANTYILNKNMSLSDIFSLIENPDIDHIVLSKLTIKEGTTIPEVAKEFAQILNISDDEIESYRNNLQEILDFAKTVDSVNTEGVGETIGTNENYNVFRKDEVIDYGDKEG